MATYKGRFRPKNPQKYEGDSCKIIYRSSWERAVMKWADFNPNIEKWSSEEVVVHYIDQMTGRHRRYFVDFKFVMHNGRTYLVEVKPKHEVLPPKRRRSTRRFLQEVITWGTNQSKWKAATLYAKERGWEFKVFTEDTLKAMGIKLGR